MDRVRFACCNHAAIPSYLNLLTSSSFCPKGFSAEIRFLLQASLLLLVPIKLEPGLQGRFPKDLEFWGTPEALHNKAAIRLLL